MYSNTLSYHKARNMTEYCAKQEKELEASLFLLHCVFVNIFFFFHYISIKYYVRSMHFFI